MAETDDNLSMKDQLESNSSELEEEEEEEAEYEVEEIRDHRIVKRGKKFFTSYWIKWVGYPEEDKTWEREENVFALDLVEAYWNSKGDDDADKSLYYQIHNKKFPTKKSTTVPAASTSLDAHVEKKKNERNAVASSSKTVPESTTAVATIASTQKPINQFFTKQPVTSRKGKEVESRPAQSQNTDDTRKTRGVTKKPNYKDYYDESDLMELDEEDNAEKVNGNEVIDDPNYNNDIDDWEPIAKEVTYIGREFQGAPLYCVIKWVGGEQSLHPCNIVRNKCPKLLVDAFIKEYSKVNHEPDIINIED